MELEDIGLKKKYTTESIVVLEGLDPVRRRPGMYTDLTRPNHLIQEVVDNSVDEVLEGFGSEIEVELRPDGSVSVADRGRGMPVDIHPVHEISGVELIMTTLHAGAKFDNDSYRFAGGLHGVGVSVVNALSLWLEVEVRQNGNVYGQRFESGVSQGSLAVKSTVGKKTTGTTITFLPDASFFDSGLVSVRRLRHVLRAKAILCSGLTVRLITFDDDGSKQEESWLYENGLAGYLSENIKGEHTPVEPFTHQASGQHESVEWAATWTREPNEQVVESYVNLIPTAQGGTHVNGLRAGLTDAMREFCEFRKLLPRGLKLTADDVLENCSFILSAKLEEPHFSGQTKERLSSREATPFIGGVAKASFSLWLNEHPHEGEAIADLAIDSAQKRSQASKKVKRKTLLSGPALPGKLADCTSQEAERSELFLVEGDSAGGSAKQARDRDFQAVLPLRGKILNTWEVETGSVLASQTVMDIAHAIAVEPGSSNIDNLRYHKICILADADSDGAHIATLLCALFLRHFRVLVEGGFVYVALPPLYRIDVGKKVYYAIDDAEKQGVLDRLVAENARSTPVVQRFKGLGEMDPLQLRETTMAPATRKLVRLYIQGQDKTDKVMDMMLAKKRAADRRRWLEDKGDQAQILKNVSTTESETEMTTASLINGT